MRSFLTFFVLLQVAVAAPSAIPSEELAPAAPRASWHHPKGHHVERLFRRGPSVPIGSPGITIFALKTFLWGKLTWRLFS